MYVHGVFMEINIVKKKVSRNISRVALVYPSIYEAMASSLVVHIIYYYLNEYFPEIYVERFHNKKLSGSEDEARSLETGAPLKNYELIITSLHYEIAISNLVRLLYYSGLNPNRELRNQPILAGGPVVMSNPHPYSGVIDAFIIGEAEETLPEIMEYWLMYRGDKKRFLENIAGLDYVYVPGYSDPALEIHSRWTRDLDKAYYPIKQFRDTEREPVFGNGFILETSRGCRYWCRFCMEGMLFKPYRWRSIDTLKKLVDEGLRINNVDRVLLYSLIFPSNADEKKLLQYLVDNSVEASLPSIRLDQVDEDFLELVKSVGQRSLTIAPESFSPFIQRIIGKYMDLDMVLNKLSMIISHGFNVKLYMMYGFKGERLEDTVRNIEYLRKLAREARSRGLRIAVSLNPLVPKPKTVFQWIGMVEPSYARSILKMYRRELGGLIETRPLDIGWSWVQAAIALADESISKILIDWSLEGGDLGGWRRVLKRHRYDLGYVFKGYMYGGKLPWDNIVLDPLHEKIIRNEYLIIKELLKQTVEKA